MSSPRPTTGLIRLATAGTAVLLLAGCGSSSDSGSDDTSAPTSTSAPATSDAPSSPSSTTSTSSSPTPSATDEAEQKVTATLDAPAGGEHKPAIQKGEGDAVIVIRHRPADAPVRAVIVNKGAQNFSAKIQTGSGPDATTLQTLQNGTHRPLTLTSDAKAIRIRSNGRWLVKLLHQH